jgi:hypothetical protein
MANTPLFFSPWDMMHRSVCPCGVDEMVGMLGGMVIMTRQWLLQGQATECVMCDNVIIAKFLLLKHISPYYLYNASSVVLHA